MYVEYISFSLFLNSAFNFRVMRVRVPAAAKRTFVVAIVCSSSKTITYQIQQDRKIVALFL